MRRPEALHHTQLISDGYPATNIRRRPFWPSFLTLRLSTVFGFEFLLNRAIKKALRLHTCSGFTTSSLTEKQKGRSNGTGRPLSLPSLFQEKNMELVMFADDVSLFNSYPNKDVAVTAMQAAGWTRCHKLTLNTNTCEVAFFTNNLKEAHWYPIQWRTRACKGPQLTWIPMRQSHFFNLWGRWHA